MANKITKEVKMSDEAMSSRKLAKKAKVKELGNRDRIKEGGSWPAQGFGPEPDMAHYLKSPEKADFVHEEQTNPEPGDWPNPVKKPTAKDIGAKAYLGHFAGDQVLRDGHNTVHKMNMGMAEEKSEDKEEAAEKKEFSKMGQSLDKLNKMHKGK